MSRDSSRTGWGPGEAIIFGLGSFILAQFLAAVILGLVLSVTGAGKDWIDAVSGQFIWVLLSDVIVVIAIWYFLKRRKVSFAHLGFGRSAVWRDLGYSFLGYITYFVALVIATMILGATTPIDINQKQELGFDNLLGQIDKVLAFASLVLLPPIIEETVFRGFVFTGLRTKLSFMWTAAITSILFAAPHLLASSKGLHWAAGADTLILSFVLCYLREKTGALWAPIFVHALKNGVAFTLLLTAATS